MEKNKDDILKEILDSVVENAESGSREVVEDDKYEVSDLSKTLRDNYYFLKTELDDDGNINKKRKRARCASHEWF